MNRERPERASLAPVDLFVLLVLAVPGGAITALFSVGIGELVEWCSSFATLLPGDVIASGTPSGVGPLTAGDQVVIKVEQVGELSSQVVTESGADGELEL